MAMITSFLRPSTTSLLRYKRKLPFIRVVAVIAMASSLSNTTQALSSNANGNTHCAAPTTKSSSSNSVIPPLDPDRVELLKSHGISILPLNPIGAKVYGLDFKQHPRAPPPEDVRQALEAEMAHRGFVVFKEQHDLSVDQLLNASEWWGGREIHSTHGVHPATPDMNRHIFRLSNDRKHGILGVGPQWHNDGSFEPGTFSHVGYYMVRVPEHGGGTYFAHQGAAFDALPADRQEFWQRLTSVNSNSGVVHPMVHTHPISGRKSCWLHLGMTGAVIEKLKDEEGFRLLNEDEMKKLFNEYNNLLNDGLEKGYSIPYEYEAGDCIFIDNLAVGHRASPDAHKPASVQGLRIMHRTTVKAVHDFEPDFDLPLWMNIHGRSPFGPGVWMGGGIGFRWDENIHMQN